MNEISTHTCSSFILEALEAIPDLRDLALETVRDHGLEMTFQHPAGLANYRFFGGKMLGSQELRSKCNS